MRTTTRGSGRLAGAGFPGPGLLVILLLGGALLAARPAAAGESGGAKPKVADLIALHQAGLGEDLLIAHVAEAWKNQPVSAAELAQLRAAGVPPKVLEALQQASRGETVEVPKAPPPPPPPKPTPKLRPKPKPTARPPTPTPSGPSREELERQRQEQEAAQLEARRRTFWQKVGATSAEAGVELTDVRTPHATLCVTRERAGDPDLVAALRELFEKLEASFGRGAFDGVTADEVRITIFDTRAQYERLLQAKIAAGYLVEDQAELMAQGGNQYDPRIGTAAFICREISGEGLKNAVLHFAGHAIVRRLMRGREPPAWLQEGCASYCEELVTGETLALCVSYESGTTEVEKGWKAQVLAAVQAGRTKPLATLAGNFLVDLKVQDIYQARSVLMYLIAWQSQRFLDFLRYQREGQAQAAALMQAFGVDFAGLDENWKHFVLKAYK